MIDPTAAAMTARLRSDTAPPPGAEPSQHPLDCALLTHSGIWLNPFALRREQLCIEDIAHALAHLCRFVGHTAVFYSVAQHSVMVAERVRGIRWDSPTWRTTVMHALLHDASEAYLGDISSPHKRMPYMAPYRHAEERAMWGINDKFVGEQPSSADRSLINLADRETLEIERDVFLPPHENWPSAIAPRLVVAHRAWSCAEAKERFLALYDFLNPMVPR